MAKSGQSGSGQEIRSKTMLPGRIWAETRPPTSSGRGRSVPSQIWAEATVGWPGQIWAKAWESGRREPCDWRRRAAE
jgi:hypothetical protein